MARTQTNDIVNGLWTAYNGYAEAVSRLSNTQLDTQVPAFGGRQTPLRNSVYSPVFQSLEHTVHVAKILQVTGAPGAQATESQAILSEAAAALGKFIALYSRMTDEDLDRSFENQTPRGVAEHIRRIIENGRTRADDVLAGRTAAAP